LGVALLVPASHAAEVDGLRRALDDGALSRIPAHLTLVPPVNVREDEVGDALAVLRAAAAATRPFTVDIGPAATFHPVNPVLYLAVDDAAGDVRRLRDRVFVPPLERSLSLPFEPHITIADDAPVERIEAALVALVGFQVALTFRSVHLLEEQQEDDRRVWRPIGEARFGAASVVGRGGIELSLSVADSLDDEAARFVDAEWAAYAVSVAGESHAEHPFAIVARSLSAGTGGGAGGGAGGQVVGARGQVVGAAVGAIRNGEAYLAQLIVAESERNLGVGAHLLAAVESLAAERGCHRLTLRTRATGPAQRFYERHGWRVYAHLPRWRDGHDFSQMERVLRAN